MLAPIEWLKDFCKIEVSPHELASKMTLSGSKVEAIVGPGAGIEKVVTGRIEKIEKHPDADKLVVTRIRLHEEDENLLQIVTGATNVREGQVVPVALDGSTVAGGQKIKNGKLRGVPSNGMLCSMAELNLEASLFPEAEQDGIFILPAATPLGRNVFEALDLLDPVIEFEITSNRPDCFSVEGLGRELAITLKESFHPLQPTVKGEGRRSTESVLSIEVQAPDLCPLYSARLVDNVVLKPSPFWMRRRLALAGVRPINTIVDITNYVMLELGQPLHAFDRQKLEGERIVVRQALPGEKMTTLDEKEHELQEGMLLICDAKRPVALAGVMGGENSQITENTRSVIFEAAYFLPGTVRTTASALNMRTESSSRFERGLDPHNVKRALDRACELVELLSCGEVAPDRLECRAELPAIQSIPFCMDRVNRFLGLHLSPSEVEEILVAIECQIEKEGEDWKVSPPSFRPDLEGFADLAEEVARFHDYNRIPATLLPAAETTVGGRSLAHELRRRMKQLFVSQGYYEAYTYSFMSPKEFERLGLPADSALREAIRIRRAAEDTSLLRTTVLPAMLTALHNNSSRALPSARLFEAMRTYHPTEGDLPREEDCLAVALYDRSMNEEGGLFYELKFCLEEIASELGLKSLKLVEPKESAYLQAPPETPCLHPYRSAWICLRNQVIGYLGYLHPTVAKNYDMPTQTAVLALRLAPVVEAAVLKRKQAPLPKYPASTRDLALVMNVDVPAGEVEALLRKEGGSVLERIELFDVYRGQHLPQGKKSLAFQLSFRSPKSTLQEGDIQVIVERMLQSLAKKLGIELRQ